MQDNHGEPADVPRQFAAGLAADLTGLLGSGLAGAYLHGSAVLGGWTASRSDVDMLFVLADGLAQDQSQAAGDLLLEAAAGAPGRGLECSAVSVSAAAAPGPPWLFELHVSVRDGKPAVVSGRGHPGDRDLLMHYAVTRSAGLAVAGPSPGELIGPVPRPLILEYLADELSWGLAHAAESYAVLNACRALVYLRDGDIVSKLAGARAALRSGWGQGELIAAAIDQQTGRQAQRPASPEAVAFVEQVRAELSAGA